MAKQPYIVIRARHQWEEEALKHLEDQVIRYMDEGYVPVGGAQLIEQERMSFIAIQTMALKSRI